MRSAAYAAMARDHAAADRRRRSHRAWAIALLVAAGTVAGVFQSCAGSKAARSQDPDQPSLHAAKKKPARGSKSKAETEDGPHSKTAFDQAATDLQAMFDQMGDAAAPEAPSFEPATPSSAPIASPGRSSGVTNAHDYAEPAPTPPTNAATPEPHPPSDPASLAPPLHEPPAPATPDASVGPPAPALTSSADLSPAPDTLALGTVALCSRVERFGRFTPFIGNRFLAGRTNAAIVYVEVDHFTQLAASDAADALAVELGMSVELFHDGDGSRQWRSGEAVIRDHSRTRRRDFYLVQRIDLPANLSVGNYNLKVTVRDRLAPGPDQPETQSIMPIQIVADAGLLGGGGGGDSARPISAAKPLRNAPFAGPEPLRPASPLSILPGAARPLASRPTREEHRNTAP